ERTADTGAGLEIFAHGALCYAYSGQCLLSSYIGGRSGNRGMCAQPCRREYILVTGKTDEFGRPVQAERRSLSCRCLLSPRDLCTYEHLAEIVNSPVASIKIEGRMKSPGYVATIVSIYRRALDALAGGAWTPDPDDLRDLLLAFNRGFTPGRLFGSRGPELMGRDAPDNRGIAIGTVIAYDARTRRVSVKTTGSLIPDTGDGLFITTPGHEDSQSGFSLNNPPTPGKRGTVTFAVPRPVPPGSLVCMTSSRKLDARVRQIIARPDPSLRHPVPLDMCATVSSDGTIAIQGTIRNARERNVIFCTVPERLLVPARSNPLTPEGLEQRLRKTGGTQFIVRNLELRYEGGMFAPPAAINSLRREFVAQAAEQLISSCIPRGENVEAAERERMLSAGTLCRPGKREPVSLKGSDLRLAVIVNSPDSAREAARSGCDILWYESSLARMRGGGGIPCERDLEGEIDGILALCVPAGIRLEVKLPRITGDDVLEGLVCCLPGLISRGLAGIMVDDPGSARVIREEFPGLRISGSPGLNVFNCQAAGLLAEWLDALVLSPELSSGEIRTLTGAARECGEETDFALIVQGSGEAMISADDFLGDLAPEIVPEKTGPEKTFAGIEDSTGRIFPVHSGSGNQTYILNAVETCLLDHLPVILESGVNIVAIDARFRPPAYAGRITRIYRDAIGTAGRADAETGPRLAVLKDEARAISLGGITTAHFLRGL
ncbi:MAG TPA: U32 family peptidase, partial [Methanoregula sp.]|nr:U32 family peptidase [Methanoregula sp.]